MARPYPGDLEWQDDDKELNPSAGDVKRDFRRLPTASEGLTTAEVKSLVRAKVQAGVPLNDPNSVF